MRLAIILLTLLIAGSAGANHMPCGERESMVTALGERFSEAPIARGLDKDGYVIEVLASRNGGSWTILATDPNGQTCMVAVGEGWQAMDFVAPGEVG